MYLSTNMFQYVNNIIIIMLFKFKTLKLVTFLNTDSDETTYSDLHDYHTVTQNLYGP